MSHWVSPLPSGVGRVGLKLFRARVGLRPVADSICERGWKGRGVRLFGWPCGTWVVVTVGCEADVILLRECADYLLATYARHCVAGVGALGAGPRLVDVLQDLNWVMSRVNVRGAR